MKFQHLFIVITLLCITACSVKPKAIYQLQAKNDQAPWVQGKQYLDGKIGDIAYIISYKQVKQSHYIFDVEFHNLGASSHVVSSDNFSYKTELRGREFNVTALDPEVKIIEALSQASALEAKYRGERNTNTLFSLLFLVSDIAQSGSRDEQAKQEREEHRQDLDDDGELIEYQYQRASASMNRILTEWQEQALRKTTLPPNYTIGGTVHLPITQGIEQLELVVNIGEQSEVIPFVVKETPVARYVANNRK